MHTPPDGPICDKYDVRAIVRYFMLANNKCIGAFNVVQTTNVFLWSCISDKNDLSSDK